MSMDYGIQMICLSYILLQGSQTFESLCVYIYYIKLINIHKRQLNLESRTIHFT